jgi:trehalose 6-phosphate synthase
MTADPQSGLVFARDPAVSGADSTPIGSTGLEVIALTQAVTARAGHVIGATAGQPSTSLVPVAATEKEAQRARQRADALSQLYHGLPATFDRQCSDAYRNLNRRYAAAIATAAGPGATALVYDLHLQLVPAMLRRQRPDLRTVFVLPGGFPPAELFYQLPDRADLITGLLGADHVAVAHHRARRGILDLAHELAGRPCHGSHVTVGRRRAHISVAPIPADTGAIAELAATRPVRARAAQIHACLDSPGVVYLSIAGPHEAEAVEQRLAAFDQLLTTGRLDPGRDAFVHLALGTPQNTAQRELRTRIERTAARINGVHASIGRCVVHCLNTTPDPAELAAYYLAADVMVATPIHGGPVTSAEEFLAARPASVRRLVLSELTTTAGLLPSAHLVNPRDSHALQNALIAAATGRQPTAPPYRPAPDPVAAWLDHLASPAPADRPTAGHVPATRRAATPSAAALS